MLRLMRDTERSPRRDPCHRLAAGSPFPYGMQSEQDGSRRIVSKASCGACVELKRRS